MSETSMVSEQSNVDQRALKEDLLAVFAKHGVRVGVGLIRDGVAIRSQDERVSAANIGILEPYEERSS